MSSRSNVRYSALPDDDNDGKFDVRYDPRFEYYTPGALDKIPWKSIFLAISLLFLGCVLLLLSFLILTGRMFSQRFSSLLVLQLSAISPYLKNGYSHDFLILQLSWHQAIGALHCVGDIVKMQALVRAGHMKDVSKSLNF
ncbi:hypothetical protein NC652_036278 [Populus alba x Populus x berolinensis]|nr:hypothetical protein NC652_036278 [Populus alba x Populus x berolinensis]